MTAARGGARRTGFTLLEMSVVLVIIAGVMYMAMGAGYSAIQSARLVATQQKMKAIEQALMQFRTTNDRLPCPGDLTIAPSGSNYGIEADSGTGSAVSVGSGACTGGTPAANNTGAGATNTSATAAEGALPSVTLGLPPDFMYDGWGNKFRYAVDIAYTALNAFPKNNMACLTSPITVNDATGTARTTTGMYALISHGANGHGAYTRSGTMYNGSSTNTNELTNCHCNSSGSATTYSPSYVEMLPSVDHNNSLDNFDDLVTFKERWQLQVPWESAGNCSTAAVYVGDSVNCRVLEFSLSGTYVGQFPCSSGACTCGSSPGQFSNGGIDSIAIDKSGNFWVVDYNNGNVQKFSSSGSYITGFGCGFGGTSCSGGEGSGNGEFAEAYDVVLDSSGSLWVGDKDNFRIQKFNGSGSWLMTIGGDKGDGTHTCTQCSSTTSCTCYSGTGTGQFSYPEGLAFDKNGNLWVYDTGNAREQLLTTSGSLIESISTTYPWSNGIAVDSGDNLWTGGWASPNPGYSVNQFNSSGSATGLYLDKGDPSCCEGSANGLNYGIGDIAVDPSGNIWINDSNNNRLEKFNSGGSFLLSVGGSPPSYSCETSPATSEPSCPGGTGTGQFGNQSAWGMVISGSR